MLTSRSDRGLCPSISLARGLALCCAVVAILLVGAPGRPAVASAAPVAAAVSTGNGGWQWQSPLPHGATYHGTWFADSLHGWMVTDGCILSTADGGATVDVRYSHDVHLRDITFVGRCGWAVGYSNGSVRNRRVVIFRSVDAGDTWSRVPCGVKGGLVRVQFATARVGWAVGFGSAGSSRSPQIVMRTTDAGRSWSVKPVGSVGLSDLSMTSAKCGIIAGAAASGAGLWRTADGGATWKRLRASPRIAPAAVSFVGGSVGWAATDQAVYRTGSGGKTWHKQLVGNGQETLGDVAFADAMHGWVTGTSGSIWVTQDGGTTWRRSGSAPFSEAWGAPLRVQTTGAAAAVVAGQEGSLGRTADAGATWSWAPSGSGRQDDGQAVDFADDHDGWVVGAGTIRRTTDGGATWVTQYPGAATALAAVDFVDAAQGWAVGDSGQIIHTTDGGTTWVPQTSGTTASLDDVFFLDATTGWAVGSSEAGDNADGVALTTADGGAHWTPVASSLFPGRGLHAVTFADALHGWLACDDLGDDGYPCGILATSDGGLTWKDQASYLPEVSHSYGKAELSAIVATGPQHAVAVGYADNADNWFPLVGRTSDGGATWQWEQFALGGDSLTDVAFSDGLHGWATSSGGTVFQTTDGGSSWITQRSGAAGLTGIFMASSQRGWICDAFGGVLTTSTGGARP
jgi:photosystem II stability/assembly factor-like uncharacterized protein